MEKNMVDQTPDTSVQSAEQLKKDELVLAEKALAKAKIALIMKKAVFLSTILFSVYHKMDETVPTACTDGLTIKYNPTWFLAMSEDARVGLLAHEANHIALCHMERGKGLDPIDHNHAADHVTNILLTDNGFVLPEDGYCDLKYRGWTTKQVYDDLVLNKKKPEQGYVPDLRELGSITPTEEQLNDPNALNMPLTPAQKAEHVKAAEAKIKGILVAAVTQSKLMNEKPGSIPGEVAIKIDELINPKLDYTELLQRFMQSLAKDDYTWSRPNKRFMPDFYMPTQYSSKIGHIGFAFDTSGSISKTAIKSLMSEGQHIINDFKPDKVTAVDCDKRIHNIHVLEDPTVELLTDLKFIGGGGTSFTPVFEYFEKDPPDVLIYFTDLYAEPIKEEPSFSVIWLCWSNHAPAEYGETIYYNE